MWLNPQFPAEILSGKLHFFVQWGIGLNLPINLFSNNIKTNLFNAVLGITGAVKGISRKKLFQDLGLEILFNRDTPMRQS